LSDTAHRHRLEFDPNNELKALPVVTSTDTSLPVAATVTERATTGNGEDRLYTFPEAAKALGVPYTTFKGWMQKPHIAVQVQSQMRNGKQNRVVPESLFPSLLVYRRNMPELVAVPSDDVATSQDMRSDTSEQVAENPVRHVATGHSFVTELIQEKDAHIETLSSTVAEQRNVISDQRETIADLRERLAKVEAERDQSRDQARIAVQEPPQATDTQGKRSVWDWLRGR
jgi:uncharacterized coiled-coil protein SlyX